MQDSVPLPADEEAHPIHAKQSPHVEKLRGKR